MRVLMTADAAGGVWTYVVELTRALPTVDFLIATMGPAPMPSQREQLPRNARLEVSDFALEWMNEPWEDVARAGDWLLGLEEREEPDIVHLNGYAHGVLPFRAPKVIVGHSCVRTWWRAVKGHDAPPSLYQERVAAGLRGGDLVIAPTEWMLNALEQEYGFPTKRRCIYNGRSPSPQRASGARCSVFAAGRLWDDAKNIRAVVDAAPRIAWPVRIAGDGEAPAARNLEPLGLLSARAMQQAFAEAAVYLFPAVYEPFGLSILEAALAGCALIIGDIPSLRELWEDVAVFVDPHDRIKIARAANEVITNRPFREFLAASAQKRAAEYSPKRMAEGYLRAYGSARS